MSRCPRTIPILAFNVLMLRAAAAGLSEQTRHFDCGSFSVDTSTTVRSTQYGDPQGVAQDVRILNHITGEQKSLNLDPLMSGQPAQLDSLASSGSCFHTRFTTDYLIMSFACENEHAVTCSTGMGDPGNEWVNIYDSRGQTVVLGRRGFRDADIKRLDQLGLSFSLWQQLRNDIPFWLPSLAH